MPELPEIGPIIRSALSALASFILNKTSSATTASLGAAINGLWEAVKGTITALLQARLFDKIEAGYVGNDINDLGGAIEAIGENQHNLWHHLRYTLMPNTIQLVWDFVLDFWIYPLRRHLGYLAYFQGLWNTDTRGYMWQLKNWTHDIVAEQRGWRAKYVYPQLRWLMSPPKVAYYYVQAFLTEMAQYLAYEGHTHDRDALTRMVIHNSPRLWRYSEQAAVSFLLSDVNSNGRGDSLPPRPAGATEPPPLVPPIWEPWITTPSLSPWPDLVADLPELHASYDNGPPSRAP